MSFYEDAYQETKLLPNHSPNCVISRVNHPMIDFSPHHLARVRRECGMAKGKGHEIWQSRPTINLSMGFFHSLSLQRTRPGRGFRSIIDLPGR